ncbi:helix-turn-helix domain-containing protein [Tuberibacillus calidus]|jgi:DNA-binding Xre family transcriptional regulator|uniref:helix-turn-helix domain-containing protein n=1 Tax=Tuberibacillus calidus TaxID=340097 RepID=UPI00042A230E|nr:helix-turn-helix domain-containing protein [Tuberibacillus calidus]
MLIPSYKPLEITLIKKDKTKSDLRNELGLSPTTIAKIGKNEFISMQIISKICEYLGCNIDEVIEFIEEKDH